MKTVARDAVVQRSNLNEGDEFGGEQKPRKDAGRLCPIEDENAALRNERVRDDAEDADRRTNSRLGHRSDIGERELHHDLVEAPDDAEAEREAGGEDVEGPGGHTSRSLPPPPAASHLIPDVMGRRCSQRGAGSCTPVFCASDRRSFVEVMDQGSDPWLARGQPHGHGSRCGDHVGWPPRFRRRRTRSEPSGGFHVAGVFDSVFESDTADGFRQRVQRAIADSASTPPSPV